MDLACSLVSHQAIQSLIFQVSVLQLAALKMLVVTSAGGVKPMSTSSSLFELESRSLYDGTSLLDSCRRNEPRSYLLSSTANTKRCSKTVMSTKMVTKKSTQMMMTLRMVTWWLMGTSRRASSNDQRDQRVVTTQALRSQFKSSCFQMLQRVMTQMPNYLKTKSSSLT